MPRYISGQCFPIQVVLENMLWASGAMRLKHDGKRTGSKAYTRRYEMLLKGKPTGVELKFAYDEREDTAEIQIIGYHVYELKCQQLLKGVHNERIPLYEPERNSKVRTRDEKSRSFGNSTQSSRLPNSL